MTTLFYWGDKMADSLEKQLARIAKKLQPKINEVMQKEVYEEVKDIARKHVKEDVYEAYEPIMYDRKNLLISSWGMNKTSDGIEVYNTRYGTRDKGGTVYIPKIIESGSGYEYPLAERAWRKSRPSDDSRPFIENTRKEIKSSGIVQEILKKGLNQKGIKVE